MLIHIPTPPDFSFAETINAHGWPRLAPFTWHETTHTLERVEQLVSGQVVLLSLRAEPGEVVVNAAGSADGGDEADITRRVRRMLQLDLPLAAFHDYCRAHPKLAPLAACGQGRMRRSPTLYEDAVKEVCNVC